MVNVREEIAASKERRTRARIDAAVFVQRGMTHALTITPDFNPGWGNLTFSEQDARDTKLILSVLTDVFRELGRELASRRLGYRVSATTAKRTALLTYMGYIELVDERRLRYPHAHLGIRLTGDEPAHLEAFFRERLGWAVGTNPSSAVRHPLTGRPIRAGLGRRAHAHLRQFYDEDGWARYIGKNTDETSELVLPEQFLKSYLSRQAA